MFSNIICNNSNIMQMLFWFYDKNTPVKIFRIQFKKALSDFFLYLTFEYFRELWHMFPNNVFTHNLKNTSNLSQRYENLLWQCYEKAMSLNPSNTKRKLIGWFLCYRNIRLRDLFKILLLILTLRPRNTYIYVFRALCGFWNF